MKKIFFTLLRAVAVILIIYAALVLYIVMRQDNILSFAKEEVELRRGEPLLSDTILVIGYNLGAARAVKVTDSLNSAGTPAKLELLNPFYSEKEYLRDRYGVFYPF